MAPVRPPKPQRQPKASKKAGTNGISDSFDSEEVFERGVDQEEQGERYQFGEKARARFEHSITNYKRAIELELASEAPVLKRLFDCHFNCGRVLVHYAITFASGRTACVEFMQDGIRHYRESVTLGANQMDLIDACFNLASSLSSLGDMISAGAVPSGPEVQAEACWEEAKNLLIRTLELQATLSSEQPDLRCGLDVHPNADEENSITDDKGSDEKDITVEEYFSVTPSVMIDTLAALVEVHLTLLPFRANESRAQIDHYLAKMVELNTLLESSPVPGSRKLEIENLIINVELSFIENELSDPTEDSPPVLSSLADHETRMQSILSRLENLSTSFNAPTQDVQDLIALANNYSLLCSTCCLLRSHPQSPIDSERLRSLLSNTLDLHSAVLSRLRAHRMHPMAHLLPHETTPLIASSLIGQAEVHLLLHTLSYPHLTSPLTSPTPYQRAFGLALEAYNETKAPFILSPASLNPSPTKIQVVSSPLAERREDWPCVSARLEAIKMIIRAKWLLIDLGDRNSDEVVEQLVQKEIAPLVKKFEITRMDVVRFEEESERDGVWCMSDGREAQMWRCLLRM